MVRNRWPEWFGTGGRNGSEQAAEFIGIGIRVGVRGHLPKETSKSAVGHYFHQNYKYHKTNYFRNKNLVAV